MEPSERLRGEGGLSCADLRFARNGSGGLLPFIMGATGGGGGGGGGGGAVRSILATGLVRTFSTLCMVAASSSLAGVDCRLGSSEKLASDSRVLERPCVRFGDLVGRARTSVEVIDVVVDLPLSVRIVPSSTSESSSDVGPLLSA
jgi:hypothetical protein